MSQVDIIMTILTVAGACISAYVGVRVGLAKLHIMVDTNSNDVRELCKTVALHDEDLTVHDMEIGSLMDKAGIRRVIRQKVRNG